MNDLSNLMIEASNCTLCELHKGRNKAVFSKGNPKSDILICGMVPAADENAVGLPFVGRAGQLLDKMLADSGLSLESVYITNLVKCYLAAGLPLQQDWVDACLPYLMLQIDIIKPKVIITLGKDASIAMTKVNNKKSMGDIVLNNPYTYSDSKIFATYHPSYLLRGGGDKHRDYGRVIDTFNKAVDYSNYTHMD